MKLLNINWRKFSHSPIPWLYILLTFVYVLLPRFLFIFVIVATEFELELLAYWRLASYIDLPTYIELNWIDIIDLHRLKSWGKLLDFYKCPFLNSIVYFEIVFLIWLGIYIGHA